MQLPNKNQIATNLHEVLEVRSLTPSTFVMRLERQNITFRAGQHLGVGPTNSIHTREYSVYSGENEPYLEILVKEVLNGFISPALRKEIPGNRVMVEEPTGYFSLPPAFKSSDKFLFIASGSGIAPFHSLIRTYPKLNYQLLHGIRYASERYDIDHYAPSRYTACTSREKTDDTYFGRVTHYLEEHPVEAGTRCYLCGSSDMIDEVYDLLVGQGVPQEMIHLEVYY